MAIKTRSLATGCVHYASHSLKSEDPLWRDESDFFYAAANIRDSARQFGVGIHAYALLPDGFCLLATPHAHGADLSGFIKAFTCKMSNRAMRRHCYRPAWKARYDSVLICDDQWHLPFMTFVERVPVLKGLARTAYHYPYSSYRKRFGPLKEYWLEDLEEYELLSDTPRDRADVYRLFCMGARTQLMLDEVDSVAKVGQLDGLMLNLAGG